MAIAILVAGFALWWFQPQQLLINREIDEALPAAPQPAADAGIGELDGGSQPRATLETLRRGEFRPLAHDAAGSARLLRLPQGDRYLRFEGFHVENGPDLRVYLSEARAGDAADALAHPFIDLGPLKGNVGDQNYRIPRDADIGRFRSAIIWCRRFAVGFAAAPLA